MQMENYNLKKILLVFGTRPEAIKMAPLVQKFKEHGNEFETKICITAQHREMLDQVLHLFRIQPDFDLNIMKSAQNLYDITSEILIGIKQVLEEFQPDIVFVHGDTTTSMAAALASYYKKIDVAHIEAGLRTYNIYSPYPEEMNRQLTSKIAKWHFTPTIEAQNNLLQEGIEKKKIFLTGNTVIDALLNVKEIITSKSIILEHYSITNRRFILVTGHRRENFGNGFINICEALKELAYRYPDIDIVYPLHLNPNVKEPVQKLLHNIDNIYLIAPLEYEHFVYLMSNAYFVMTDSGGIQEEAPSLGKPVLVMRDTTERPEAVEAGTVKLVGTDKDTIIKEAQKLLDNEHEYMMMSKAHNPYGDGKACDRIIDFIKREGEIFK